MQLDDLGERLRPVGFRLARQTVDEVETHVVKPGLAGVDDGGLRLLEIVPAADELQKIVVRSLNADGQAVDALLAQELQSVEADAVRVHLNSDLRVKPDVAVELEGVEYLDDAVCAVEAGRAAAEIYGIDLVVLYRLRRLVQMREQRFVILRHQMLAARERIEVAVAAFAGAEGYVYIYSQTSSHGQSP